MNDTTPHSRLPVTVITGFLGSGKTTLLAKLLPKPGMRNSAVIINEFGEVGLDHMLVAAPKEDMVLLSSGCLCCTVRGDLVNTLASLTVARARGEIPAFDRVLVETTGLADPVPVLMTVTADEDLSRYYRLDGVLTVVEAVNGPSQLDAYQECVKQAAVADRLLISKVDLADAAGVGGLEERLQRLNPGAEIHQVLNGEIDPQSLFQVAPREGWAEGAGIERWLRFEAHDDMDREGDGGHDAAHPSGGGMHSCHDHAIRSFAFEYDGPISPAGLRVWIDMLGGFRGPNLLRVKGLLNVDGHPVVVQAVQHLFHPPVTLDAWPGADRRSRLVFITRDIARDAIERTFKAFEFAPAVPQGNQPLNADDYARFLELAKRFRAGERLVR